MIVSRQVLDGIRGALESAYPHEGCGFLLGERDGDVHVRDHLFAANDREAAAAATRYLITPEDFRAATREADARQLEIVGVYHSHPDVPPRPSAFDRDHAWPWYQYLIVSVVQGRVDDMRAWELKDDRSGFDEREVRVTGNGSARRHAP
jgi:proteasome lid subunit RPN8/RPN11